MTAEPSVISKISHILLQCSDLEKSKAFYIDLLGFTPRHSDLLADGRRYVNTLQGLGLTTYPPEGGATGAFEHLAFRCPDGIEPLIETLEKAGVTYEEPRRTPYGLSIYVRDPDGNRIEFHDSTGLT